MLTGKPKQQLMFKRATVINELSCQRKKIIPPAGELRQRKRQMFGNPNVIIFILIVCLVFGYSQASGGQNKTSPTKTTLASATT
ncbi:hypothetical protein P5673_027925, partial [Acropora cervicornis]